MTGMITRRGVSQFVLPEPLARCRVADTVSVEVDDAVYISVIAADI